MKEIKELSSSINKKFKKVIIYGFGTVGKNLKKYLNNVIGVIDKNIDNIDEIKTFNIKELKNIDFDLLIITLLDKHSQEKVLEELENNSIKKEKILIANESIEIDRNKLFFEEHKSLTNKLKNNELVFKENGLNVQIQTISHCNAKCYFCPYHDSWHQQNPGKMEEEVFQKIINSLKSYKISKFCPYLENEPLLDKNLFQKVFFAIDNLSPHCIEIATNLSVLNNGHLEGFIKLANYNHEIRISFHGVDKTSYEEVMDLNFEKAMHNVKKLIKLMQDYPLNISIRGSGKPRHSKNNLSSWFGEKEYLAFWNKELEDFEKKPLVEFFTYHDRAGQKQLKNKGATFDIYRENLDNFYCQRFDQWVHFLYTGEPILCCMDYNKETALDKSIKDSDFTELFLSDKFTHMLKCASGLKKSPSDFICKRCISPGG